jgi:hypothetical protein
MQNLRHLARVSTGLSYLLQRVQVWGQPVFFTVETINSCKSFAWTEGVPCCARNCARGGS